VLFFIGLFMVLFSPGSRPVSISECMMPKKRQCR
jgi:hypothetical protein